MKSLIKKIKHQILFLFFSTVAIYAQKVQNTSYTTETGEKILRLEMTIPVSQKQAWQYFTNESKLKLWIAPVVQINLREGGEIITNYDEQKTIEDPSSIHIPIINYLPNELITLRVLLNSNFKEEVVKDHKNLQEIIQFISVGKNKTKIISSMIGWGNGKDWDTTYDFFVTGNVWTYEQLCKVFTKK